MIKVALFSSSKTRFSARTTFLLDNDSNDPASSEKPDKPRSSMRAKTNQTKKGVVCLVRQPQSHLSWADVVKFNSPKPARRASRPPIKR